MTTLLETAKELSAAWGRECRGEEYLTRGPWVEMFAKLDAAIAAAQAEPTSEPDMRHPKIQALSWDAAEKALKGQS